MTKILLCQELKEREKQSIVVMRRITNEKENKVERRGTEDEKEKKVAAVMTIQGTERREANGREAPAEVMTVMMMRE